MKRMTEKLKSGLHEMMGRNDACVDMVTKPDATPVVAHIMASVDRTRLRQWHSDMWWETRRLWGRSA